MTPDTSPDHRGTLRTAIALVALSLAVRCALLAVYLLHDVPTVFDEGVYVRTGEAFAGIYRAWLHGESPAPELWTAAYGRGVWPPLHASTLGVAFLLFGQSAAVGRALGVLISAATTLGIFGLGRRLGFGRGATAGALLHALFPGFVAFSSFLWSEALFVALVVGTALATLRFANASTGGSAYATAGAAGALAGLATLTRSAGLPLALAVPGALLLLGGMRRRSWIAATLALALALSILAPWLVWLGLREHRPVLLSTRTSYYLLFDNSAPSEPGHARPGEVRQRFEDRGSGTTRNVVLAQVVSQLQQSPLRSLGRLVNRARALFGPDVYILRHLLAAIWPPVGPRAAAVVVLIAFLAPVLGVALAARGALAIVLPRRRAAAMVLLLLAVAAAPTLTISNSRMGLPTIALLLPFAGVGATARLPERRRQLRRMVWLGATILATWNVVTVQRANGDSLLASAWYGELAFDLGRALGIPSQTADCVALAFTGSALDRDLEIRPESPELRIAGAPEGFRWSPQKGQRKTHLLVESATDPAPVELVVVGL
ncbi:MAG TPA: glycosyltransferase family 39 protein, partial [Thermoanaerobaculia bacterium]|nr:glycosyltransferase family 39 protein [Thermoanaerobaculia bacterium]